MASTIFINECESVIIQCSKEEKMKTICDKYCNKINSNINSLLFLYGGKKLNLDKNYHDYSKEKTLIILVYKNDNEIYPKCEKLLDDLISSNNKINYILFGLTIQIEHIIKDINNNKQTTQISSQLMNINIVLNNIIENIKKNNEELNITKIIKYENNNKKENKDNNIFKNDNNNTDPNDTKDKNVKMNEYKNKNEENNNNADPNDTKDKNVKMNEYKNKNEEDNNNINNQKLQLTQNISEGKKEAITKNKNRDTINEIICIYNKQDDEIDLLYNYILNEKWEKDKYEKDYLRGKKNINEKYIEIYINDKKIDFNTKYKSNEIGEITVKFKFKHLLTNATYMFYGCSSLISIDLSSFNTTKIESMCGMFYYCSSLKSINLSSFNTTNVDSMRLMFCECSSLKSLDLSSFNTSNVYDMSSMFEGCYSLKTLDLSSFNTINVKDMNKMFRECSSLTAINISSFNTNDVNDMYCMFYHCSSLNSLDLSSFNTNNVNNMGFMFEGCSCLKALDLSSFNINNVNSLDRIFAFCYSLKKENIKVNDKKILDKL